MAEPIGLIAGEGRLPVVTARGIHASGREVACVGLRDQFDADLPGECDRFKTAGIIQLGRWIRLLRRWGCKEVVMVGRVKKVRMYDPFYMFRQMPDWRAAKLWFGKLRHDRRTDMMLGAIADELGGEGISLIDSTKYIPEQLADVGVMTKREPSASQRADIEFALPIIKRMGDLDIGQSIAVKDREVISVEAIEGTDRMIERTGELCRRGGWTMVKVAKPGQDMRFDVPTVGEATVENLKKFGGTCLALEAGKAIMINKAGMIEAAERLGVVVVGVEVG